MCEAIFARSKCKISHLVKYFTQPAVVMVVTNIKYVCSSPAFYICLLRLGVHALCRFIAQMQQKRALFEEQTIPSLPPLVLKSELD